MANQQKQKVKVKKGTKKGFFDVEAPLTSTKISLYASSKESLEGKTVKLDLTKNLRGKNLELKMKIANEKDKLIGKPESIQLMNSYIRRSVRKGTDYVEDSFEAECRDAVVRIKPLLVTRRRVSRAVLKSLRENTKKYLEAHLKTRNYEEIFSEIISNKLQKQLAVKLKKIYPLALCEIRSFEVISKKQIQENPEQQKS